jgi:Flp pilus assembly CpaE family ATPase
VGVGHLVPSTAGAEVLLSVVESAVSDAAAPAASRAFADPVFATGQLTTPSSGTDVGGLDDATSGGPAPRRGSVIAVWGPTGAPGRTTVAVTLADELARLPLTTLLVDADVYGGVVSSVLGLLDESPGVAAACRQAQSRSLDQAALAALAWQISPTFRVLTGLPRADRWPELRTTAIEDVLGEARQLAEFTVVDLGFALESDEELSFDTLAPRRNGATLAVLDHADLVLAVASADPVGIQRLIRGLSELREAEVSAPVWIVLNRVRKGPVPGEPGAELNAALQRFAGRSAAALLPYDRAGLDTALARGNSLAEASPNSPLRHAVTELAVEIAGARAPVRGRRRR